ncbi:response regulator transcription factor [Actinomycetospora termitidis]|uniref:Response regulator transcription factor n=1 Tax=Actinomycetospora termitidis TaxID=3053470 RepID=A0ABT7MH20_9PSEU|nr:response regulator transcription factor [Actinomycetospora sp. Odt1-22]MDL5159981.1 response regulator transcription factor [Actinomycetospora sp. Odt1-22]
MTTVVVAEDSVLLREGLVRLLDECGATVLAAVDDGPSLVEAVCEHEPDVAVVDVRMPPDYTDEGLRAALEARRRRPGTAVLVLSQYVEPAYAAELLAAGAVGYLLKDRVTRLEDLADAVDRVAAGGTVLDPEIVAALLGERRRRDPLARLTPREREVLGQVAEGRSNAAIGRALVLSQGAVEKHISSIFDKLDLHEASGDDHRRVMAVLAWLGVVADRTRD